MSNIVFSYTKAGVNEKKLKCVDGWYHVNVGKFNAFNVGGELYLVDGVREMINDPQSRIGQKIAMGYLKGEREHPVQEKGMTKTEYLLRLLHIEPKNISHHIKAIEFEDTGIPTGKGFKGNVLNCTAWIKPDAGPIGQILKADLDDPEINVAFSLRSIISSQNINGVKVNKVETFITFDWVFMPGMDTANKWDTKTLSAGNNSINMGFDNKILDIEQQDLLMCNRIIEANRERIGNESDIRNLLTELNSISNANTTKKDYKILKW